MIPCNIDVYDYQVPDAGTDGRQEKGMTEDKMIGWHHLFNGYEFEQALGNGKRQGSLVCCSPWGYKESDMTERLSSHNVLYTYDNKKDR